MLGTEPNSGPALQRTMDHSGQSINDYNQVGCYSSRNIKCNLTLRVRRAIWHQHQCMLQLGSTAREPIVSTCVANFQRKLVLGSPASRHICILQGRENITSNLGGKSKTGNEEKPFNYAHVLKRRECEARHVKVFHKKIVCKEQIHLLCW